MFAPPAAAHLFQFSLVSVLNACKVGWESTTAQQMSFNCHLARANRRISPSPPSTSSPLAVYHCAQQLVTDLLGQVAAPIELVGRHPQLRLRRLLVKELVLTLSKSKMVYVSFECTLNDWERFQAHGDELPRSDAIGRALGIGIYFESMCVDFCGHCPREGGDNDDVSASACINLLCHRCSCRRGTACLTLWRR